MFGIVGMLARLFEALAPSCPCIGVAAVIVPLAAGCDHK